MNYNEKVLSKLYPVLRDFIYHFVAYRETLELTNRLKVTDDYWTMTYNAHIKTAVISWCMVFASTDTNPIHWKNLRTDESDYQNSDFNLFLQSELNFTKKQLNEKVKEVIDIRNKLIAHRELKSIALYPCLNTAFQIALLLDVWIRKIIMPDIMDSPLFSELAENYKKSINIELSNTLGKSRESLSEL